MGARSVKNFLSIMGGNLLGKAVSLVVVVYLARHYGPGGFGRYHFVIAYVAFFGIFSDMGVNTLLTREVSRGEVDPARAFGDAIILRAVLTVAAAVAAVAGLYLMGYPPGVVLLGAAAVPALFFSFRGPFLRTLFEVPFAATLRMHNPVILNSVNELAVLAVVVWSVGRGATLAELILLMNLVYAPGFVLLARVAFRELRPVFRFDPGRLARLARSALPLGVSSLLEGAFVLVPVFLLTWLSDAAAVGHYSLPFRVTSSLWILPVAAMMTLLPSMSSARADDVAGGVKKGAIFVLACGLPLALGLDAASTPVVRLLGGSGFAPASSALSVMAWGTLFYFLNVVFFYAFTALGRQGLSAWVWGAVTLSAVILGVILIPGHGEMGAAAAYTISLGGGLALNSVLAVKTLELGNASPTEAAPATVHGSAGEED